MTDFGGHKDDPPEEAKTPDAGEASEARTSGGIGPDLLAPEDGERKGGTGPLDECAAVRDYLNRVGAETRGLRSAVVKECAGQYSRDLAVIRFAKDGDIECSTEEHAPTDLERQLIGSALSAVAWPEVQPLARIIDAPDMIRNANPANVFELRGPDGKIMMVQVRIEIRGERVFVPWTYWNDQVWRSCEPDGPLPLYGLDQIGDNTTAFIHEGAKAARAIQEMVAGDTRGARQKLAEHPWGAELDGAAHVGWIGGALSPHRTDWSALHRAGIKVAYIVADNDRPGVEALPRIVQELRHWPIQVMAVRFNSQWPSSFDLADPFPDSMFLNLKERRVYKGPSFNDQCRPATWMTVPNPVPAPTGKGRPPAPTYRLRKEALRQWWLVAHEKKPLFVPNHDRTRFFTEEAFNTAVRPFSNVLNNAALLKQHMEVHVEGIAYEPGREQGIITVDGRQSLNTWAPARVTPVSGDAAPFHDFLRHLFPNEADRHEAKRWIATLAARPAIRMKYGLVLCSGTQGVGKTTLCEILKGLVGPDNASAPSANDIKSDYNDWFIRKRLIWVNEIYEGGSWTTYNKLKSFITDDDHLSHAKYEGRYPVKNWAHFVLCSNSTKPLALEEGDRRFFVPEVTENKALAGGWDALHQWIRGDGLGIILNWAEEALSSGEIKPVGPGEHAPMSARKARMIAESRGEEEALVRELAALAQEFSNRSGGRQVVFIYDAIRSWLSVQMNAPWDRKKDFALRRWIDAAGLHVPEKQFKIDRKMRRVAALLPVPAEPAWSDLEEWSVQPDDLMEGDL